MSKQFWLRRVYPLRLRETFFYSFVLPRLKNPSAEFFDAASLVFAPAVRLTLIPTDCSHLCIALTGFYELDLSRAIAALAKKGGLLVDAGANAGYYSCIWAGGNPANKAVAFEPSPSSIGLLRQNVKSNSLENRVEARAEALGREQGSVLFDVYREQSGWSGISLEKKELTVSVECRTLDDFMRGRAEQIAVLKIDTEGADAWVLQGAKQLLDDRRISHVFFEVNEYRMGLLGVGKDDPRRFLESCGYKVDHVGNDIWHAFPHDAIRRNT